MLIRPRVTHTYTLPPLYIVDLNIEGNTPRYPTAGLAEPAYRDRLGQGLDIFTPFKGPLWLLLAYSKSNLYRWSESKRLHTRFLWEV